MIAHRILLTFDDGPDPDHTASVLDELARRGVSAIFFVLGERLESAASREIAQRAAAAGHIIGNHTYSHRRLTQLTDGDIRHEIQRTEALIGGLDGGLNQLVKLWRPPYSDRDDRVDSVAASLGYTRMLWNATMPDWTQDLPPAEWAERTLDQIRLRQARGYRNTVCLLHDPVPGSAERVGRLLERIGDFPDLRMARYDPESSDGLRLPEDAAPSRPRPICPADAVSFPFGDSLVATRTGINVLYILNETASLLWESLSRGVSTVETARRIAREYDVSQDLVTRDMQAAMASWRVSGLLGPSAPESEDPGPWPPTLEDDAAAASTASSELVAEGFAVEHAYRILDTRFRVRYSSAHAVAAVHPRFANLAAPEPALPVKVRPVKVFDLVSGPSGRPGNESLDRLAYLLFFEIVRLIHPNMQPMACLHSSVVSWGDASIALVGNNGSGKSTLAAALASAGAAVASDDRLFLDFATGRPLAAPNAVGLKRGSWSPLLSRYPNILRLPVLNGGAGEVRFLPTPPPARREFPPVTHIFFPRYQAGAATAATSLTAIQTLKRIVASEGWITSDPAKLERFLGWVERLHAYDLPFSDLDMAAACIAERFGA